jgi:hypothetical protein
MPWWVVLLLLLASSACGGTHVSSDANLDARGDGGSPDRSQVDGSVDHLSDTRVDSDGSPTDPSWAIFAGGGLGKAHGWSVATDHIGNAYVIGSFVGPITFGTTQLLGSGGLLAKVNAYGQVMWAVRVGAGALGDTVPAAVAVNSMGDIYVAGKLVGTQTFGATTLTDAGGGDWFVGRFGAMGKSVWAVSFGGAMEDGPLAIAADAGYVYTTGQIQSAVAFGSTTLVSTGKTDLAVVKLDVSGTLQWAVSGGGEAVDFGTALGVDPSGNVIVAGQVASGPATFGPFTTTGPAQAVIVTKLDASGKFTWLSEVAADQIGAAGLAVDALGNSYMAGSFKPSAVIGTTTLTATTVNAYVAKLDPSGKFLWAVNGSRVDPFGICVDTAGYAFVTGFFVAASTLGTTTLTPTGQADVAVAKLDSATGAWIAATSAGGKLGDHPYSIATVSSGGLRVTGAVLYSTTYPTFDTLRFGQKTYTLDGNPHLFLWSIPPGAL